MSYKRTPLLTRMYSKSTNRSKGIIALFILSGVWAFFGIPARFLSKDFLLMQQIYPRLLIAAIAGVIIFHKNLHVHKLFTMPKKEWLVLLFRISVFYLVAVPFYVQAYTLTKFSNVSFLGAIPTTAVLGFILLREKVTMQKLIFILLSVFGILLIAVKDYSHFWTWGRGDILALIADFFFSLSYIARKWQTNYLNNKELAVYMLFGGAVLTFFLSLILGEPLVGIYQFTLGNSAMIFASGVLNVVSLYLMNFGFAFVEAALASNIVSLESFFAVIIGVLLYKEIPTIQSFIGGLCIVLSVILLNKEEVRK